MRHVLVVSVLVVLLCRTACPGAPAAVPKAGSDWPNFLGPAYNQTSPEKGLLRQWPAEGPKVLWRVPLGQGWGSPSVAGSDVVACWTEPGGQSARQEGVVCLDTATGRERWRYVYDCPAYWEAGIGWGQGGVRASPCITDKYIFTLGTTGILHALDRKSGKVIWSRDISKEWTQSGEKGWSFSPIVADGKLIVYHGDGGMRASDPTAKKKSSEDFTGRLAVCLGINPDTGKDEWVWAVPHVETSRRGEGQTPIIAKFGGRNCAVLYGQTAFVALRASDGKEMWKLGLPKGERGTGTCPIIPLDKTFLCMTYQASYLFEVAGDKEPFEAKLLWRKSDIPMPYMINPVYHNGYLYGLFGDYPSDFPGSAQRGTQKFVCADVKSGTVTWQQTGFTNSASQILADGLIFARSFQTLHLVEPSPKGYSEKGRFKTHDLKDGYASMCDWVMPVLSRGKLYIRTGTELLCLKVAP